MIIFLHYMVHVYHFHLLISIFHFTPSCLRFITAPDQFLFQALSDPSVHTCNSHLFLCYVFPYTSIPFQHNFNSLYFVQRVDIDMHLYISLCMCVCVCFHMCVYTCVYIHVCFIQAEIYRGIRHTSCRSLKELKRKTL